MHRKFLIYKKGIDKPYQSSSKKATGFIWTPQLANTSLPSVAAKTKSSRCQSSVGQEWDKLSKNTDSSRRKSPSSQRLLLGNEGPRLAAMLLQQLDIGDGHAAVDGFAHVING
jgi:hypothetical protein